MMSLDKIIAVNFSQKEATSKVLSQPNQFSSHQAGWNGMYLEYHDFTSHETPEHYPTQHVIAIQTKGTVEAERKLGDRFKQEEIHVGDVCLVPAYTRHRINSKNEQGLIMLSIEPSFIKRNIPEYINSDNLEFIPHFAQSDPLIYQIGLSLKAALQNDLADSCFYAESLGIALVAHLIQFYTSQTNPTSNDDIQTENAKIKQAKDYIHAHLNQKLSLKTIATTIGMSQYHFCRVFKETMGLTPWQYVIKKRIELAKQLLKMPQLSILEISNQMGYATSAQFSNFFRKHMGISPSTYRQKL